METLRAWAKERYDSAVVDFVAEEHNDWPWGSEVWGLAAIWRVRVINHCSALSKKK